MTLLMASLMASQVAAILAQEVPPPQKPDPSPPLSQESSRPIVIASLPPIHDESQPLIRPLPASGTLAKEPALIPMPALVHDSPTSLHNNPSEQVNAPKIVIDPAVWWKSLMPRSITGDAFTQPVDTNSLAYLALMNSPRIQAISQNPLIRELQVVEADSLFDPLAFVKTAFNDRNDPVGNTLTTGGPPFLEDHLWNGEFGVRRKARTGANIELGQRLGFHNSNSVFFLPQDQGTATLALTVTQPLLRGRGRFVNESQVLIAQAQSGTAWDTFANELQDELQQVAISYWRLVYDRTVLLQKKQSVERGEQVLRLLEGRHNLDSSPSQIARARSAVETRRTGLANAYRDVKNAETEIRRRIADQDWAQASSVELLPQELITPEQAPFELDDVVRTALEYRREIQEAIHRARIAGIQQDVGENELLPELSLLIGGYVSALNGDSGVFRSWADQFENKPGYNVGLNFEMPYGNRAARSRLTQRKLQMVKIRAEVEEAIQRVIAESQVAVRRLDSAQQTRQSAYIAILAAIDDLIHQNKRWEAFALVEGDAIDGQNPTLLLNQLLDSQERLAAAELIFAQAEFEIKAAEVGLYRTMGTLLRYQNFDLQRCGTPDLPQVTFGNQGSGKH